METEATASSMLDEIVSKIMHKYKGWLTEEKEVAQKSKTKT